jgi:molybdenum cofactor synthesis domain-containing protein
VNSANGTARRQAAVLTVSDRSAAGQRADTSGPLAAELLCAAGWDAGVTVVPDEAERITAAISALIVAGARLVVTTGGTGVGPRDVTPEATRALLRQELPGIAEEIRRVGLGSLPQAMISRGLAGLCGSALVVNLAGSNGAVRDGVPVILQVAGHIVDQVAGGDHS